MKIYYAHHLWKYDTNIETWEQNLIAKHFPLCEIVNPNGAIEQGRPEQDIMADCLQMVRACDALVFSSLSGVIGQGVMQEIKEANRYGLPVWYIHHGTIERPDMLYIEQLENPTGRLYATVWAEGG